MKVLCEVAAAWRSPEDKFRKYALEQGPAATGFSRPILERGLDDFFEKLTPTGFNALLEQELGHFHRLDEFAPGPAEGSAGHLAMVHGLSLIHI